MSSFAASHWVRADPLWLSRAELRWQDSGGPADLKLDTYHYNMRREAWIAAQSTFSCAFAIPSLVSCKVNWDLLPRVPPALLDLTY